jgi:hypothetical protein
VRSCGYGVPIIQSFVVRYVDCEVNEGRDVESAYADLKEVFEQNPLLVPYLRSLR